MIYMVGFFVEGAETPYIRMMHNEETQPWESDSIHRMARAHSALHKTEAGKTVQVRNEETGEIVAEYYRGTRTI